MPTDETSALATDQRSTEVLASSTTKLVFDFHHLDNHKTRILKIQFILSPETAAKRR